MMIRNPELVHTLSQGAERIGFLAADQMTYDILRHFIDML